MNQNLQQDAYLRHHGILGMKWGVRRYQNADGTLTAAGKKRYAGEEVPTTGNTKKSEGSTKATAAKSSTAKKTSEMTDEEIRAAINRMQLEKQYKQLAAEMSPQKKNEVMDFTKKIMGRAVENIATQAATYAVGKAVNMMAGGEIVNPKKGQKDK